ncbi:MAG: beta-ketoacyl-ACP synthase II [Clostridiales bacterium]|nr:beta-ketoacyl-ACP synthase II [Clostridiales bacterium]
MDRRVVVTGLGVVSPIGNDVNTFWEGLIGGKVGIGPITKFDTSEYMVKIGAEVKAFDAAKYMEKTDLRKTDINVHYAMGAAAQAVEDSKIEGNFRPERAGVYFGSGIGGITTFENVYDKFVKRGPRMVSPYFIPMIIPDMAAGTLAIKYGMRGPALPSVSACASGTNALGEAYRAIRHGYADVMITGGTEAAITRSGVAGFINMQALNVTDDVKRASLPFHPDRGGFVIGEGAGALILEEYEHAVNRGAKIYAEVTGYGSTCDAYHMTAPDPEAKGASEAIRAAYEGSGCPEASKIYVNAHGTGTPLNDKSETLAFKKVFGDKAYDLKISSTKSMTGHMLGGAGAVEAVASIMAIDTGVIPPTVGLDAKDPDCDLDYTPLTARESDVEYGISTSLGFGGHNACVAFKKGNIQI